MTVRDTNKYIMFIYRQWCKFTWYSDWNMAEVQGPVGVGTAFSPEGLGGHPVFSLISPLLASNITLLLTGPEIQITRPPRPVDLSVGGEFENLSRYVVCRM